MKKKKFTFPCPHCGGTLDVEMLADIMPQLASSFLGGRSTDRKREASRASIAKARESYAAVRKERYESATPEEREARREQCRQAAKIRWAAKRAAKEGGE